MQQSVIRRKTQVLIVPGTPVTVPAGIMTGGGFLSLSYLQRSQNGSGLCVYSSARTDMFEVQFDPAHASCMHERIRLAKSQL